MNELSHVARRRPPQRSRTRRNRVDGALEPSFRGDAEASSPKSIITACDYGFRAPSLCSGPGMTSSTPPGVRPRASRRQVSQSNCTPNTDTPPSVTKIPTKRTRSLGLDSRRSHRPPLLRNRYISKASCRACLELHVIADGLHTSLGQLFFRAGLSASPTPSNAFQLCRNSGLASLQGAIGEIPIDL